MMSEPLTIEMSQVLDCGCSLNISKADAKATITFCSEEHALLFGWAGMRMCLMHSQERIMNDYERIWLQAGTGSWDITGDVTWCQNKINDDDVEYVRVDLYAALQEALDKLDKDGCASLAVQLVELEAKNAALKSELKAICNGQDEDEREYRIRELRKSALLADTQEIVGELREVLKILLRCHSEGSYIIPNADVLEEAREAIRKASQ